MALSLHPAAILRRWVQDRKVTIAVRNRTPPYRISCRRQLRWDWGWRECDYDLRRGLLRR